jgi:hypothetical protein
LKKRFAPLDVSVDVSKPAEAKFDVFLGECNMETRAQVEIALNTLGIEMVARPKGDAGPLLVMGVSYADAERIHSMASRGKLPLVIVNRDFQRFDVRLDTAPATPELKAFLLETTKMPEHLVPKVLGRLPLVTHPSVGFSRMCELVAIIGALGGTASGHLLSFQSYSLAIDKVGDADASMMILRGIGGLSKEAAKQALWTAKEVQGPLSHTLARWTQLELKKVGTTSRMVQR